MKSERGISLIALIIVVIIIVLVGGIGLYFAITSLITNIDGSENITQSQENKDSANTNNSQTLQLSADEIKKQNYPNIFGEEGTKIYPPQSYIVHNILSINPNKDERFIVTNATSDIKVAGEETKFIYLINENDKVEIDICFKNPKSMVLQEKVDNIEIFIDDGVYNINPQNLRATRYILIEDIPYYKSNTAYADNKCYIVLKPSAEIQNTEIVKIAQNIVIDKTRGEFEAGGVEGSKIVTDNENFKKNIGDYTFDFENTSITYWRVYNNGLNEINYFITENEETKGLKVEFPYTTVVTNFQNGIEDIKHSVEKVNEDGTYTQELTEMEIDGVKFYALKETVPSQYSCYVYIYVELEGNQLIRFSKFGEIEDVQTLEQLIRELILNKVLYKN